MIVTCCKGSPPVYYSEDRNEGRVGGWKYGIEGIRGEGIRCIRGNGNRD
jgi:hypothetical protein